MSSSSSKSSTSSASIVSGNFSAKTSKSTVALPVLEALSVAVTFKRYVPTAEGVNFPSVTVISVSVSPSTRYTLTTGVAVPVNSLTVTSGNTYSIPKYPLDTLAIETTGAVVSLTFIAITLVKVSPLGIIAEQVIVYPLKLFIAKS